jgi:hypothetical protein
MSTPRSLHLTLLVLAWLASAQFASSQELNLNWWSLDGGGGVSSGGGYVLIGTIGQPDAGLMSGGPYALFGGFWNRMILPRPLLAIRAGPNRTVVISWLEAWDGYELEESPDVQPGRWTPVVPRPVVVGDQKQVSLPLPPSGSMKFYRLRQP